MSLAKLTPQSVPAELERMTPQIRDMLPEGMSVDRFKRVAMTAIVNTPALLQCSPQSVMSAALKAAQDGLLPDGREGAIVPRGSVATWQPMVHGIIKKVKEKGGVANLSSNLVYDGENFDVDLGDDEKITHKRDIGKVARGKEIAVYAIAKMKDGSTEREIMTREQVEDVRKLAKSGTQGPWGSSWDEMARKTVVRRLSKRLPALDDDTRRVIERVDDLYDFGKQAEEPEVALTIDAEPGKVAPEAIPALETADGLRNRADRLITVLAALPDNDAVKYERAEKNSRNLLADIAGLDDEAAREDLHTIVMDALAFARTRCVPHEAPAYAEADAS